MKYLNLIFQTFAKVMYTMQLSQSDTIDKIELK